MLAEIDCIDAQSIFFAKLILPIIMFELLINLMIFRLIYLVIND